MQDKISSGNENEKQRDKEERKSERDRKKNNPFVFTRTDSAIKFPAKTITPFKSVIGNVVDYSTLISSYSKVLDSTRLLIPYPLPLSLSLSLSLSL